jgi:hypothetical protein
VKGWIDSGTISSNGAGTYTVGHVAAPNEADPTYSFSFATGGGSTGYPLGTPAPSSNPANRYYLAHAGWSLLILYSSASVYNHQFYLYDTGKQSSLRRSHKVFGVYARAGWGKDICRPLPAIPVSGGG